MAININANMALGSAQYLDARQSVATLDALLALDTNIIPNGFECYVEALDCKYKYHEDYNETDTGHWKLLNFGEAPQIVQKAIISIIDDDGSGYTEDDHSGMRTWLNKQGIPMAFALPMQVTNLDPYVSDILASGNEIIPHGLTANDGYNKEYADDMISFETDVATSKTLAEQKGYITNICVYPRGIQPNEATNYKEKMEILQKYFDYGFNINTVVEGSSKEGYEDYIDSLTKGRWNAVPFKTMPDGFNKGLLLNRLSVTRDENMQYTWWTKFIDNCIANKGYLVLFTHSHFSDFLEPDENGHTGYSRFQDIINYIKENYADEVEFLTPSKALEKLKITNDIASNTDKIDKLTDELEEKLDVVQSIDNAGKFLVVGDDGTITFAEPSAASGDSAENIAYVNADYSQYSNVDLALDALFAKVYYVKPTCSLSANPAGGTFEMGTVITAPIVFNWTTNKPITSQTLTGFTLENTEVRTATYETDISTDKTFTLSVSDGENNASSSVSYKFMNNVFWGSAAAADTYDSAFVDALSNKKLTNSVKGTYSFNVADGEYGFWAVPSNMTISTVWIGGFEVTVESVGTISYLNSKGYTRDYNLYKTGQSGLGSISAEIK